MKIASVVFGGGVSTLGMDVVLEKIKNSDVSKSVQIDKFNGSNPEILKSADILLVSLYWFENVLEYFRLLKTYGIDPRKGKPVIILGGIAAVNTRLLDGFFNYVVLGDGEVVIDKLIGCILDGVKCEEPGVVSSGDLSPNRFVHSEVIPAHGYIEDRGNNTTRIEIARGCKNKCAFCQLGHTKPYREQPLEIISYLLSKSPTNTVGLFAPDRSGYSRINELEKECKKYGKHNSAEDLRLDAVRRLETVSKLKFGVEGFTEASRKKFRKVASNEKFVDGLRYIFTELKKPDGGRHTVATMYMIGDLPGEDPDNSSQFWDVLREADKYCIKPFTLFLTLNSFSPKPYTPYAREEIHPYNDWKTFWQNRPRFENMTIAARGGMLGPSNRLVHLMTLRGDERLTKLMFWLSNDGFKLYKDGKPSSGRQLEQLIKKQGVDPDKIYGRLDQSESLPSDRYAI